MKKITRIVASVLCAMFVFSLCACGSGNTTNGASAGTSASANASASGKSTAKKTLNVALDPEVGVYDAGLGASTTYAYYQYMAAAPLVELNADGTNHWISATKCDINKDATQFTFSINKDLKWSDGTDCTAQDFVNTIVRALNPKSGNGYTSFLYVIKNAKDFRDGKADEKSLGVEAVDSKTLKFTLDQSCMYFLSLMTLPVYMATPSKVATGLNADWSMDPKTSIANGPFYMAERVAGQYITFKKNPYYIEADKIKLDSMTMKFLSDPQAKVNAFKTGEIDMTVGVSSTMDEYNGKPELSIHPSMQSYYMLMNWKVKPLDDARVREALILAINRADLTKAVGKAYKPTTNFVAANMTSSQGKKWSTETDPLFKEDIKRAQDLLAQAGYPNGQGFPVLTYKFPSSDDDQATAEVLQAQLKKNLGINIQIQSQEKQVYTSDRRAGTFDLCRMSWTADYCEPTTYLNMYTAGSSYNDAKISIPDYDKLMSQAVIEPDAKTRNDLYHQAEAVLITKNFALAPLYNRDQILLFNTKIRNFNADIAQDPVRNGIRYQYLDVK